MLLSPAHPSPPRSWCGRPHAGRTHVASSSPRAARRAQFLLADEAVQVDATPKDFLVSIAPLVAYGIFYVWREQNDVRGLLRASRGARRVQAPD